LDSGLIIINKAAGMTSHDVVNAIRKIMKTKKVGHSGTLDPMATGVLNVFVGQATKTIRFHQEPFKRYRGRMRLGYESDTLDAWGKVVAVKGHREVSWDAIQGVIPQFTGEISQIPPMFSALRHQGKRLYELARQGVEVDRPPRKIQIRELTIKPVEKDLFELEIQCSKGTYIRTLMDDIAIALNTRGIMTSLTRLESDGYTLEEAASLEAVAKKMAKGDTSFLIPMAALFPERPVVALTPEDFLDLKHGKTPSLEPFDGLTRLLYRGRLVAIGDRRASGNVICQRFLREAENGSPI